MVKALNCYSDVLCTRGFKSYSISIVYIFSESRAYTKRFAKLVNIRFSWFLLPKMPSKSEFHNDNTQVNWDHIESCPGL